MKKISKPVDRMVQKYKKGSLIITKGDMVDFVAEVKSGTVRLTRTVGERKINMMNMEMFREWCAMMVITGKASEFDAEAVGVVEIVKTSKEKFLQDLKNDPVACRQLLEKVSNLFLDESKKVLDIVGASAIGKVASVIKATEGKTYPLTHKLVANLTGLTRETVTLQMLKLEKMKLIDNANRKVKILDKKKLEKLIG